MAKALHKFGIGLGVAALTVAGTLTWSAEASAQPSPATRPAGDGDRDERSRGPDGGRRFGGPPGDNRPDGRPDDDGPREGPRGGWRDPSDEEWEATRAFMAEHSPHRLALYEQFEGFVKDKLEAGEEPPPPLKRVRSYLYGRYRSLEGLKERDPEFFAFAIEQFETEDRILGAMIDERKARRDDNPEGAAEAREQIEAALTEYVQRSLAERQARIDRLEDELGKERRRLEKDRGRTDELKRHMRERIERMLPGRDRDRDRDRDRGRDQEEPTTRPEDA